MASHLKKTQKDLLAKLLTEPPFPSIDAAAKTLHLHPDSVYTQRVADPDWYAGVKATREAARLEWLTQQQADAMAELHEMTAAALDVKREHLKHYFAMSVPAIAEKASDYVLDRVIGKAEEKVQHSGEITMRTYRGVPVDEV